MEEKVEREENEVEVIENGQPVKKKVIRERLAAKPVFPMSKEDMAKEALLLAREEKRKMERQKVKELSETEVAELNKKLLAKLA